MPIFCFGISVQSQGPEPLHGESEVESQREGETDPRTVDGQESLNKSTLKQSSFQLYIEKHENLPAELLQGSPETKKLILFVCASRNAASVTRFAVPAQKEEPTISHAASKPSSNRLERVR